jgi:hypothetical protein
LEVLRRHPRTPHAIVDYRDLVTAPAATVREVYARLGFTPSPELERALALQEGRSRARESKHEYSLEEFGLARDVIQAELADLYATFGWRTAGTPGPDGKGSASAGNG